jgi:hypothetical protein
MWAIMCVEAWMTALGMGGGRFGLVPSTPYDWVMNVGMHFLAYVGLTWRCENLACAL